MLFSDIEDTAAVVIDCGSGSCRAGRAGDEGPSMIFPTINVGAERSEQRGLVRPMEGGLISDWTGMEAVWRKVFDGLGVKSEETPVLLTVPPLCPAGHLEQITASLFETFDVPSLYLASTAAMALLAEGTSTGCVVASGYGTAFAVPMYNGVVMEKSILPLHVTGQDTTAFMAKMLVAAGYPESVAALAESIKEKLAYVPAAGAADEAKKGRENERKFELPDGTHITVNEQVWPCVPCVRACACACVYFVCACMCVCVSV